MLQLSIQSECLPHGYGVSSTSIPIRNMSLSQAQELILAEYNGYHLRNVAIAFIVLEVFFVGLRYVARYISRAPTGLDDIFMIPSLITNLGLCALAIGA